MYFSQRNIVFDSDVNNGFIAVPVFNFTRFSDKKNCFVTTLIILSFYQNTNAQANFTFAGLETVNFGTIDLSASANTGWATDRLFIPGYFSVVNGASFIGYSDAYNIDGYVKKVGNETFTFPVGSGNDLRTIKISAPNAITDAYASAWILGDPGAGGDVTAPYAGAHPVTSLTFPIASVSKIGQWDWQVGDSSNLGENTTGNGDGIIITVSIPDLRTFGEANDLRLVGWNGSAWIDLSKDATATGNLENSLLTGTMVAGITAIAIGSIKPVNSITLNLVSFNARNGNCSAELRWATTGDDHIEQYIAEQSSDGSTYKTVAVIESKRSANESQYAIIVKQSEGVNYYRIKMVGTNGNVQYSTTVACQVSCDVVENIMLYPNPVTNLTIANLRISTNYRGKIKVIITNTIGQQLQELNSSIDLNITLLQLKVNQYANGVYFISIIKQNGTRLGKILQLVKQ